MSDKPGASRAVLVLVFAAFLSIGLPDALYGSAWPAIRDQFNRGNASVGFLNIPGAVAYIASSAMMGAIMRRLSLAQLLAGSTILVGTGLTLYATAPMFWMIIPAVILISIGSGAIDSALNLFAAQNLAPKYMIWLHAFYGVGALAGPFVMAFAFNRGLGWRWGFAAIAAVLWLMALVFILTRSVWKARTTPEHEDSDESSRVTGSAVLRMPRVQLSILMMMGNATVEALASAWITTMMIERFEVSNSTAAIALGIYWIGLTAARILVPVFWPDTDPKRTQLVSTVMLVAAAAMMIPDVEMLSWISAGLVGLGVASIFPLIMTASSNRFGPSVSQYAIGYLVSGSTFMFAILPVLSGALADRVGWGIIPVLILAGASVILVTQLMLTRGDTPARVDQL